MRHDLLRALAIAAALTPLALDAQQAKFRAGVDLIHVGVTVFDKSGHFVTDLTAENFELYEEGRKQEVAFFASGERDMELPGSVVDPQRLRLGLLFDTSGSMTDDIQLARTAAVKFLNTFPVAQDITLVDFDTEVRIARYGQADFPRLVERIRNRKPDGWTAMYDALAAYIDGSYDQTGRKVLVMYTDGGDTRSAVTFVEALDMLRTADVTLYVVGFLEHQSPSMRQPQRLQLMQMADITGGQAFFPTSGKMLEEIFEHVGAQIRAQYSLGFSSSNPRRDGKWRRLEVRLVGAARKGLKIKSRAGYFAPFITDSEGAAKR